MPTLVLPGVELGFHRIGAGEPLLLIQGMSGTRAAWGKPFLGLLERDFEAIVFDNRGIGGSGEVTEPFSIADMAGDAAALLKALNIEQAHVLGISMGGMIAQELALAHPEMVRTLTLGCTFCGGPDSEPPPDETTRKLGESWASGDRDQVLRASWEINLSPAFREDEERYPEFAEMATALPAPRRTIELQVRAILAHDTTARLHDIAAPTLVVHGTADALIPAGNAPLIASLIPNARLKMLEGVGHLFWWEKPELSAELVHDHALGLN